MTLLLQAKNISKSYGGEGLFENISLSVSSHERLGLIGPNGSGKSTLLKIFADLETPDKGQLIRSSNMHLVYLPQEDSFKAEQTLQNVLFDSLGNALDESEYQYHIWNASGENLFPDLKQKVGVLSGGWRKRLAIVCALLKNPTLLLLDEPTNHLDLQGILWLEGLLKKADFSFVLVTHDRVFLENSANTIVELNKIYPEGYFKTSGNYNDFLQRREEFITAQIQKEQVLSNKLRREEEWLRRMPKARTTKAQYRIDQAEQLKIDLKKISTSNAQNKSAIIDFSATDRQTKVLLEMHQVSKTRDNKVLFKQLNLVLQPGVCIGLLGENGSGKSTLVGLLNGELQPDQGVIKRADNLRIVTFDQRREQLQQNQSLMHALAPSGDYVTYKGSNLHVVAWAKRFLFSADQLRQPVSHLSGGEQARVLIANLMLKPADILLLDEPTNDLDIPTLEVLEESLREFSGAVVLITHDRFLLDRLSDKILYLAGNGDTEYFADYAQWRTIMEKNTISENPSVSNPTLTEITNKNMSYEQRRELSRLPARIQKAEAALLALEAQLSDKKIHSDAERLAEIYVAIEIKKNQVNQLYQRWEELEGLNSE